MTVGIQSPLTEGCVGRADLTSPLRLDRETAIREALVVGSDDVGTKIAPTVDTSTISMQQSNAA